MKTKDEIDNDAGHMGDNGNYAGERAEANGEEENNATVDETKTTVNTEETTTEQLPQEHADNGGEDKTETKEAEEDGNTEDTAA